jgi:RimJ/RimL family protein N-acetyltransferase
VETRHLLPERVLGAGDLILRRWVRDDAELVAAAVADSIDHLRPWMGWISQEPLSLPQRTALIERWEDEWLRGGDVLMGVFLEGRVAGSCGLHHRIGPGGLELGYWTHPAFLRQGVATSAAGLLTGAAFTVPGIARVEIHHDKANRASAGIPRKLGYRFVGETPDEPEAPADTGLEHQWRLTKQEWTRRGSSPRRPSLPQ